MSLTKEEQARVLEDYKFEIIGGKIVMMATPRPAHSIVGGRLNFILYDYLRRIRNCKKCRVYFGDNSIRLDIMRDRGMVNLPEKCKNDFYIPDVMVVCDRSIETNQGVVGAPDLVVEVLSHSTEKYDMGLKKDVYEAIGVKEYWIVDIEKRSVMVYALKEDGKEEVVKKEGKFEIIDIYGQYSAIDIEFMEMENKIFGLDREIIKKFSPVIFPEIVINIDELFDDLLE